MRLNLQTDEGRALSVLLTVLGDAGRAIMREHLLDQCIDLTDAKHTLDVMNEFERAYDHLGLLREVLAETPKE